MATLMKFAPKWLQQAVFQTSHPDQVRDSNESTYARIPIRRREEGLLLYGPIPQKTQGSKDEEVKEVNIYDIVAHNHSSKSTTHCISIFRSVDVDEAESRFELYNEKITIFLEVKPELYSVNPLQKLCDTVRTNPDWSVCHVAVHLDYIETLTHPRFIPHITAEIGSGLTPLLLAVKQGSKHITLAVLQAGASLEGKEKSTGYNCFHLASTSTSALVEILAVSSKAKEDVLCRLLNERGKDEKTPLHLAAEADKPEIVISLLNHGADINTLGSCIKADGARTPVTTTFRETVKLYPNQLQHKDIKLGGTPLHWSLDKPILEAFMESGCDFTAKDFNGSTALHTMVKHKRLPCVVSLLAHGLSVEETDGDGNTPLHLAAQSGHIPTIQAVLIFEADFNAVNKSGETAWDIILKQHQSKIYNNMDKERNLMLYTLYRVGARGPADLDMGSKEFDWKPTVTEKNVIYKRGRHLLDEFLDQSGLNVKAGRNGGLRILSLDGGGIRGLVLIKILTALVQHSKVPVTEMFDWIGGTSTGGILTLALACGKTPMECQGLYFRLKDKVFVGKRPYDVGPLEEFLKKEFSETRTMASLPPKPRVTVTGVMADRHPADLHLFTNYQLPADILGAREDLPPEISPIKKPDQQELWRAARCSGAAPTYFRAAGRFIDGGLISNNPTLDLMTEVHERNCALRAVGREQETESISLVVSMGTGEPPLEKVDTIDVFRPDSIMTVPQLLYGASNMGRLLIDQACSASNRVVDRAKAWCGMADISYIRLSPQLDCDVKLDETSDEVLVNMIYLTQVYMHEERSKIEILVNQLLNR